MTNKQFSLILLLAGKSMRLKNKTKKQFIKINNKSIFLYSLKPFLRFNEIKNKVLVHSKNDTEIVNNILIKEFGLNYKSEYNISLVVGGKERLDSVYNAIIYIKKKLEYKNDNQNTSVIIHDAARPLVTRDNIQDLINYSIKYNNVVLASKIYNNIKYLDNHQYILPYSSIHRNNIIQIETPQIFNTDLLYYAYSKYKIFSKNKLDDSSIMNLLNIKTKVVFNNSTNIKITTKEDLKIIKYILI